MHNRTLLAMVATAMLSMPMILPVHAQTVDEYIKELFGESVTEDVIRKLDKKEDLSTTHDGDIFLGEATGVLLSDGTAQMLDIDGDVVYVDREDLKDMNLEYYHTSDGVYDKPDIHRTSQKKAKRVLVATFNRGAVSKKDKDTGEEIADATFGLYTKDKDNRLIRSATLKSTDKAGTGNVYRTVTTSEYNVKEWITNFDRLSPEDQARYKDLPQEEPADKEDKKTDEQLDAELDKLADELKSEAKEWVLIEDAVENGYLISTETWSGEIKDGEITLPELTLKESKIYNTYSQSTEAQLKTKVGIEVRAKDAITKENINGGKYDIYVSYINNPDDSRKVGTASFRNGVLKGEYSIETDGKVTYESDEIPYIKEYNSLPNYARKQYADYAKSYKEAKKKAGESAKEKADRAQTGYDNANRMVKLVEKETPTGYSKTEDITLTVEKGKATADIELNGASQLGILVTDMSGDYVEGAKLKVESVKGNHEIAEAQTKNCKTMVDGVIAGSTYRITQVEPPKGYVKLKESEKTVQSTITGETKETTITELKATFTHEIAGTKLAVYNRRNKKVDEWIATDQPHKIENLNQYEEYRVVEEEAVEGYYRNPDIRFTVKDEDVILKAKSYHTLLNTPSVAGCEFVILDKQTQTIVDTWNGGKHEPVGLEKDRKYILRQTKTPQGYATAVDVGFTAVQRNQEYSVDLTRVTVNTVDGQGQPIKGVEVSVINEKGDVVDSTVTDYKPYYPSNLTAGQSYIIRQTEPSQGYTQAEDVFIELDTKGTDIEKTMTSHVQVIRHQNEEGKDIDGSLMQAVDKDGTVVDEWTTGQHLIDIDEGQRKLLTETGRLTLEQGEVRTSIAQDVREKAIDNLDKGVESSFMTLYPAKTFDYAPETYFGMALENLGLTQDEKTRAIYDITKGIRTAKSDLASVDVEKVKEEIRPYLNNLIDSRTKELSDIATAEVVRNGDTDEFALTLTDTQGKTKFATVDVYGNERGHRVSGMKESEDYTIKSVETAGEYASVADMTTDTRNETDQIVTIMAERKLKEEHETETARMTPRQVVWVSFSVVCVAVASVFGILLHKRRKK